MSHKIDIIPTALAYKTAAFQKRGSICVNTSNETVIVVHINGSYQYIYLDTGMRCAADFKARILDKGTQVSISIGEC